MRLLRLPRALALALAIATVATRAAAFTDVLAPPPFEVAHRAWQIAEGLPQNTVTSIVQDREGYVWLGTWNGVVRFDGIRFTHFNKRNHPAFASNLIDQLLVDAEGSLWIANRGLVRRKNGKFRTWKPASFPAPVRQIAAGSDGSIWAATNAGLVRLHGETIRTLTTANGLASNDVHAVTVDSRGTTFVATATAVQSFDGNAFRTVASFDGISRLYIDHDDSLWIATSSGLSHLRAGQLTSYTGGILEGHLVRAIHRDRRGVLRIGMLSGSLGVLAGAQFVRDPAAELLTDSSICSIFDDREGNLWVGTNFGGLNQLRAAPIATYTTHHGLPSNNVLAVLGARDGAIWMGTTGAGVTRHQRGTFRTYDERDGLSAGYISDLDDDEHGNVWVALRSRGLARIANDRVTMFTKRDGLVTGETRCVDVDGDGIVWIGTTRGLQTFDGAHFRRVNLGAFSGVAIGRIARARDRLWIGTANGLIALDEKGRIIATPIDRQTRSLLVARDGTLWAGVADDGLWRIRDGVATHITTKDGLFDDELNALAEDGAGNLWISSNRGIFRVRISDLEAFAMKGRPFRSVAFGVSDGMRTPETNTAATAVGRDAAGRLWFPTVNGAAVVDPKAFNRRTAPTATVLLESIVADGRPLSLRAPRVLAGTRHVELAYTGFHLAAPESIRFRYRLAGLDTDWIDAGDRRVVSYSHLPPGNYQLEIGARVGDGPWSSDIAATSIAVEPWLWQRTSFQLGLSLVLLALLFFAYRIRIAQLRRREVELTRLVHERTLLLEAASRKNQAILDSADEGIIGLDADGIATFINPAGAAMLGRSAADLVGRPLHPILHPGESLDSDPCPICFSGREKSSGVVAFATRSGKRLPVDFSVSAMQEAGGMVVTFRDVTERLAIERAKDEFVATVSHELRTPLTSIRGALGLLGAGKLSSSEGKGQRMVDIAVSNCDRLLRLVNDILDSERLVSGNVELRRTTFDAADVMQQAGDGMLAMAERSGVLISVEPLHVEIDADFDRIMQALTNLVGNAVKFSPSQSTIRLWARAIDGDVAFNVTDQGRGIPAEKLRLVFERFKQVEAADAKEKGGTGLGLAICRGIAHAHGGTLSVESHLGEGSTFTMTLPALATMRVTAAS